MTVPHNPGTDDAPPHVSRARGTGNGLSNLVPEPVPERDQAPARTEISEGRPEVITLAEEIDITNSSQACKQLCMAAEAGAAVVIADMTATRFCDSSAMRALLVAHDQAVACGSQLRVVLPPGTAMMRAFAMMGFEQVLRIYPSLPEASEA
jgi:anti-sigma B factor antagonist